VPTWGEQLHELGELQRQAQARAAQEGPPAPGSASPFDSLRRRHLKALSERTGRATIVYATAWLEDREGLSAEVLSIGLGDKGGFMEMSDVVADLRVDDHPSPTDELDRLLRLHHLYLERPDDSDLIPIDPVLRAECDRLATQCGHRTLEEWVGTNNYEMRMVEDRIDHAVVDLLRGQARARPPS